MMKRLNKNGFTIIELLIATVVFSVVLMVITASIVQFGKLYYRGVVQDRMQETVRNISESVTQTIQFAGVSTPVSFTNGSNITGYCIGNIRYTMNTLAGSYHLTRDTISSPCSVAAVGTNRTEFLGTDMQPLKFTINSSLAGKADTVAIKIAYGPSDVFLRDMSNNITGCKQVTVGGQFCAISDLTTTVVKR